jgi:hypothetical protein
MSGLDFYTMNSFVRALDNATLEQCKQALQTCKAEEIPNNNIPQSRRILWKELAKIIRKQIKKY